MSIANYYNIIMVHWLKPGPYLGEKYKNKHIKDVCTMWWAQTQRDVCMHSASDEFLYFAALIVLTEACTDITDQFPPNFS